MKRFLLLMMVVLLFGIRPAGSEVKQIKLAHVAPPGSSWDKILNEMNAELKQRSQGQMEFRIYPGGVQGDEKDVVRKMRINQIQVGGFTGNGLGQIATSFRVMELPFLFQNTEEVDRVTEKLTPQLEEQFLKANPSVVLLGWGEVGFVQIFSTRPVRSLSDLKGLKMWQWEGDTIAAETFGKLGVSPVPLAITDVMTGLSTNMIEAVYAPPLGTLALQWASKVKYMTDLPFYNSMAALVMLRSEFEKLSPSDKKLLKEVTGKHMRRIVVETRKDNKVAFEEIKRLGVQVVSVDSKDEKEMIDLTQAIWKEQVDHLYSQEQLAKVQELLTDLRAHASAN
ncbi:MAG: TRAP transporter substrate-binding protein DctP [Deltaproteobacteria bacterium]|nr:TRAP transporter substrate-binding protein DctP [Deltaproteobacteria bacterium]